MARTASTRRAFVRRAATLSALVVAGGRSVLARAAGGPAFDGVRALRDVERVVALGPRPPGSPALARARAYVAGELTAAGWRVREEPFSASTPLGLLPMVNVVAEWPGRRPEVVAVGGHYDTKRFDGFRFVGANDAGSSTALLVELGRALGARFRAAPPTYTHRLLFFDGEEALVSWTDTDSLYGSRAMVAALRAAGELARFRALVVVDMIGDRDLQIRRESASTPWLTDLLWATARRLGRERVFREERQPVEDDHAPFLAAGVAASLLIDFDYGGRPGEDRYWHTAEDTVDKLSPDSLATVGEVLRQALPAIEAELLRRSP